MDNIKTKDRDNADLDIAAKEIGGVKFPRNILTKTDGSDFDPASESTLAALLTAANAIKAAAEALNGKTTAVNTGAVTVANFPGSHTVTLKRASQSSPTPPTVAAGASKHLYCDGTNVRAVG